MKERTLFLLQHPNEASLLQEAPLQVSLKIPVKTKPPRSNVTNFHYSSCHTVTWHILEEIPWRNTRLCGVKHWQPLLLPMPTPATRALGLLVEKSAGLHSYHFRTKLMLIRLISEHFEEERTQCKFRMKHSVSIFGLGNGRFDMKILMMLTIL